MEECLIEIEIESIFNSIDRIKKYCKNRPQAYGIKYRIETYLFNKLFIISLKNRPKDHKLIFYCYN